MKNAIRWLIAGSDWKPGRDKKTGKMSKWKINMITLTFRENMQDDNKARRLLSTWLEMAKYRWDMHLYVWKAEPQKRGAIHFHISTNVYVPWQELRFTWNRLLRKNGFNEIDDNSTDVHGVFDARSHENYLSDYFLNESKHEGRRPIKGKLWGCSHALSQAGKEFITIDEDESRIMQVEEWPNSLHYKYLMEGKDTPEFLKFTDIYLTGDNYYKRLPDCNLKRLYFDEVKKLKALKSQKEFWPRE